MALPEHRAKATSFLPGDLSIYDDVHLLLPNNEFFARRGRTRRYWPVEGIAPATAEDALRVWGDYFSHFADYLRPRHRVVAGLTGRSEERRVGKECECRRATRDEKKKA